MDQAHLLDFLSSKRARPIESMGRSSKQFRKYLLYMYEQYEYNRRQYISSKL